MPNLNELGLSEESTPQVDWDAPELGNMPPAVYPGIYTLTFKMPEDHSQWFDSQEVQLVKGNPATAKKFLVIKPQPMIVASHANRDAEALPIPDDGSGPKQMPPQRVSFFKNDKMPISQGGELLRALGIRLEGSMLAQIEPTLTQVDGRVNFKAELGWRAYFKSTDQTVSTHPRKKKGDLPWPRRADGTPELMATNPQTGEKAYGYLDIVRVLLPTAEGA